MDQDDYINKDEYEHVENESPPVNEGEFEKEEEGELKEAGLFTMHHEAENAHEVELQRKWEESGDYEKRKFIVLEDGQVVENTESQEDFENSPIQEEEEDGTPEKDFEDDDLLKISQEVKKKDQSRKLMLWEGNQIRNQWEETVSTTNK